MQCSLSKNKRKNPLNFKVVVQREDKINVRIKKERERKDGSEDPGPDITDQTQQNPLHCLRFPPGEAVNLVFNF